MSEDRLTEQQSLELITRMINKAKSDYRGTGIGALMWGTIITVCALVSFVNYYQRWPWGTIYLVPHFDCCYTAKS
jgi:hypothetical protein